MKSTKILCMFLFLAGAPPSFGIMKFDIFNFKNDITLSGTVATTDFFWGQSYANCQGTTCGSYDTKTFSILKSAPVALSDMVYIDPTSPSCGTEIGASDDGKISPQGRVDFVNWANKYLATRPTLVAYNVDAINNNLNNGMKAVKVAAVYLRCLQPDRKKFVHVQYYPDSTEIINPPPFLSGRACKLNGQNLILNFTSNSLNVDNLYESTDLTVSCESGDNIDYSLKLQGDNTINGRLSFGNGVSAKISINNIEILANGDHINLQNLNTGTLKLTASLMGDAFSPGVSTAYGVLLLEAL